MRQSLHSIMTCSREFAGAFPMVGVVAMLTSSAAFGTVSPCAIHLVCTIALGKLDCHHTHVFADQCLQPKLVGDCDALFPSYFFNSTSGTCERFNYGGCGGNQNRFSTRAECLSACAPDGELLECRITSCHACIVCRSSGQVFGECLGLWKCCIVLQAVVFGVVVW